MKRANTLLLVLWALVPTAGIMAQPVIGLSNMPQVGDSVIIALSNQPVAPGTAGADQTWDMTWISAAEEQYFVYEDPAVTPWADLFDDATICGRSWEDYYSYYHIDATGVAAVGYAGVIGLSDTFTMDYSDSELFIPLDYSFGDSHADDFAGTSTAAGFSLPFTGDVDFEADGYGTLILPTGTYENVVRYHFFRTQEITFGTTTTTTKEQWAWVSSDYRFWLLLMEENFDGFSTTPLIWYDKAPLPAVPVAIGSAENYSVRLFPNPVSAQQSLSFEWNEQSNAVLTLTDLHGRKVWQRNMELKPGMQSLSFDGQVDAGCYLLQIAAEKADHVTRLIVSE